MEHKIEVTQRSGWVTMACPICDAPKGARCTDSMGKPHPGEHPERRVWSTFVRQSTPAVVEAILAFIREQADKGAEIGIASEKGTTRRAAFGGGSLALTRIADAIERGEYAGGRPALPSDVTRLVIAARLVADDGANAESMRELDQAAEAFASRVSWENEDDV